MKLEDVIGSKHSGDKEQLEFIFSTENKIIVTAPAGCGKTTAMVSKIAWELSNGSIQNNKKILAMTFSVNAATKIKDSIKDLLPKLVDDTSNYLDKIEVCNYHSFAFKLLHKHGYLINENLINIDEFQIFSDNSDSLDKYLEPEEIRTLKDYDNFIKQRKYSQSNKLNDKYCDIFNRKLFPNNIITYNAILLFAKNILQKEKINEFYKKYYKMIIIDEFQDTNYLSFKLLTKLIGDNKVVLLGDEAQKIYGFLGAIDNIFESFKNNYSMKKIEFLNNYRFKSNSKMKELDKFIRKYSQNNIDTTDKAIVNARVMENENLENQFILNGVKTIIEKTDDKIAILVRSGWNANGIVNLFNENSISYFNALFSDTDYEYEEFHKLALDILYIETAGSGKLSKINIKNIMSKIKTNKEEFCETTNNTYIFDSLSILLDTLFKHAQKDYNSQIERYDRINFVLSNNSLKSMLEYIDQRITIITIHSAKGLEWDQVILPRLMGYFFPTSHTCGTCRKELSFSAGEKYCKFKNNDSMNLMQRKFQEELSVFYVGLTRAKKNIYITANNGNNNWGYPQKTSCFINLNGLTLEHYDWENLF